MRPFRTPRPLFLALVLAVSGPGIAGAHTPMGEVVENVELATASGGKASLLADQVANVIVFFRPDQERSLSSLKSLAGCEKELQGKPVRWVGVVPERFAAEAAKAAADAGVKMAVLVDAGDALYAALGVALHPTVAVVAKDRTLQQFQPFTKLNFCEAVMARIRRVLGEVSEAQLAALLDPSAEMPTGDVSAARRDLKLAEMLLKSGNLDKALEAAHKGAQKDPKSAAAQALVGKVLAAKGDCAGAVAAFNAALKLEPGNAEADAGKKVCAGKR